jgi:hypothetical protein
MSVAIFIVGVFVFLITVYGTVVSGGLLLTDRQLEEHPDLDPDYVDPDDDASKMRKLVEAEF